MKYYRVLNPQEEPPQTQLDSAQQQSKFRKQAIDMLPHSKAVCDISIKTGLHLNSAMTLAKNAPCFCDVIQGFIDEKIDICPLKELSVNDPMENIDIYDLVEFTNNYMNIVVETGLYFDWGNENAVWEYIWEHIRKTKYSELPSRLQSVFLFNNKENAQNFCKDHRDCNYSINEIELLSGRTESFDMNWFTMVRSDIPFGEAIQDADNYWAKKHTSDPVIETLHQGLYKGNLAIGGF